MTNIYDEQAETFLKDTHTKFKAVYFKHDFYFADDKEKRDIYKITLKTPKGSYTFTFGQAIAYKGQEPRPYDILACLQKYDIGNFFNFCNEFGYDTDSRKAESIYKAILKEWKNLNRLYTPKQIEQMAEIE